MSTIAEKLKIISDSCTEIKEAIVAKGGAVTGNLTTYGDSIRGLLVGGGDKVRETWDVTFVDYDGTILSHYEIPMNGTVVFPDAPNHEDEGLIFDEWNCTETDASKYYDDEMYRTIVIGSIYHRSQEWEDAYYAEYNSKCAFDEYTHIYMTYPKTGVSYGLRIQPTVADGVVIDWGDGTTTTTDSTSLKLYSHTYTEIPQSKEITVKANSGTYKFQGTSNYVSNIAFVNFSNTKIDVKIGNTVTSIGDYSFVACYGLRSVVIPSSVTLICNYTFTSCYGLQSIVIPSSVTSIGTAAFLNCLGLQSIVIPSSVTKISPGCFYGCYGLQSIVIPSSVTKIDNLTFLNCYGLRSIVIPSSVKSIELNVFNNCYGLSSINIPSSVTSIGGNSFSNCYGLICSYYGAYKMKNGNIFYLTNSKNTNHNTIYYRNIYNRLLSVKEYNGGESIDVTIPSSVTSIEWYAFLNCYGLRSVVIPSSVKSIELNAFNNCYGLRSVVIPSSVTSIGAYVFLNCYGLRSINIPSSVKSIELNAFNNCYGLRSVVIPSSVTSIGVYVFLNCYGLRSINIPSSVTKINSNAFSNCYGLQSLVIPSSVTNINGYAFSNCYGLNSITIPSSVTSIGSNAFSSCFGLKIVDYGNERTTVPPTPAGLPTDKALRYIIVPDAVYDATYSNSSWSKWKEYLIKYSDYLAIVEKREYQLYNKLIVSPEMKGVLDTAYPLKNGGYVKVELTYKYLNRENSCNGMYYGYNGRFHFSQGEGKAHWGLGNSYGYSDNDMVIGDKCKYVYDNSVTPATIHYEDSNNDYNTTTSRVDFTYTDDSHTLLIFARRRYSDGKPLNKPTNAEFYEFKMWDNGVLVRHLLPCKLLNNIPSSMVTTGVAKNAGECGAWDMVTNRFHPNILSSGGFTVSNDE